MAGLAGHTFPLLELIHISTGLEAKQKSPYMRIFCVELAPQYSLFIQFC